MKTHSFEPAEYFSTFGKRPALLEISAGDRVVTTCVDSYGRDREGRVQATGDNPLTGPISVAGAAPGDTLVIEIFAVRPNRTTATSEAPIVANAVDPSDVPSLPPRREIEWLLQEGTATLVEASSGPELVIPVNPMLGCLGVAPDRGQVIRSGSAGRYGGNMDYRRIAPGATVYFPVFEYGALIYVGDGHAAQGAGELGGTGLEISVEVDFGVDILKAQSTIVWPRGEDEHSIWSIGNARPLEEALQHATSEMLRWLRTEFGMNVELASILLSQSAEYDIANVCDPAFTVACRLAKSPFVLSRRNPVRRHSSVQLAGSDRIV